MAIALSSLRVSADLDSAGYARGAAAIDSANQRMAASGQSAGAALAAQDVAAGRVGGTLVSLTRAYVAGYGEVARFSKQVEQLQTQFELGNVSADRAAQIYSGLSGKFQLYANATEIAAKGNRDFAAVIDQVNERAAIRVQMLEREAAATQRLSQAQQAQTAINSRLGVLPAGSGAGSAQASADAFMANVGGLDGVAKARAQQVADAFSGDLDARLIAGTGKSARDSASVFQSEMDRADEIGRMKAQQIGQNFAQELNDRLIPGTAKSARDSAAVFQAEMDRLDQITQLKAQQIGQNFQQDLNARFGIGSAPKSAQASASVFQESEQQAKALDDLKAKYDPLYAAQRRYSSALSDIERLSESGALKGAAYTAAINGARSAYNDATSGAAKLAGETVGLGAASAFGNTQFMALTAALRHMIDATIAGRPPMQALAMEVGNLSYGLSGSGGFMGALKAIGNSIFGMLGPIGTAAVALGGLAIAGALSGKSWADGQTQIKISLMGMGEAAGATVADMNRVIATATETSRLSMTQVRDIAAALVQTGHVNPDMMLPIINAAKDVEKVLGTAAKDIGPLLAKAFSDPVKGADELNKSLGFLNDNMRNQIANFVAQNNYAMAQKLIVDGITSSTKGAVEATTGWSKAWDSLTTSVSTYWSKFGRGVDTALGFTKADPETALRDAQARVQQYKDAIAQQQPAADWLRSHGASEAQVNAALPALAKYKDGLAAASAEAQKMQHIVDAAFADTAAKAEASNARMNSLAISKVIDSANPGIEEKAQLQRDLDTMRSRTTPESIAALSPERAAAALATLEQYKDAVKSYLTPQQKMIEQSDLQRKAIDALSPGAKASIAYQEKMNELSGKAGIGLSDETKKALARNAAYAATGGISADIQREQQRISILGEMATVTERVAAANADLRLKVMENAGTRSAISPDEQAALQRLNQVNEEYKKASERAQYGIGTFDPIIQAQVELAAKVQAGIVPINQQEAALVALTKKWRDMRDQAEVSASPLPQLTQMSLDAGNLDKQLDTLATGSLNQMTTSLADMTTGAKTAGVAFADMGTYVVRALEEMIIKMTIIQPIAAALQNMLKGFGGGGFAGLSSTISKFFGFADGGVMSSGGPAPLRRYAGGGVAYSPQIALFGEGSRPEAYVPLPNGRSIPVDINVPRITAPGVAASNVTVNVIGVPSSHSVDSKKTTVGQDGSVRVDVTLKEMVADDIASGGAIARTLERQYGLNRTIGAY